jgi:hypothetical protein
MSTESTDLATKNPEKSHFKFCCYNCDYNTSSKKDYDKHVSTDKHKINKNQPICPEIPNKSLLTINKPYLCDCGKLYKDRSGLWRHSKTCLDSGKESKDKDKYLENSEYLEKIYNKPGLNVNGLNVNGLNVNESIVIIDTNMVIQLLKQNLELQKSIIELSKEKTINTNCNNTFNLQFYLNETCKDALNISEFVDSIKIQLSDLETTGRQGYVEGISKVINQKLNELESCKRPIHCSDLKRETIYIKDDNEWIKDSDSKDKLKLAIKQISFKNIQLIAEWRKKYPDCTNADSRKNDLYLNIVSNAMSGSTKEEQTSNINKIITNVTKSIVIAKNR